jgi:hypothetical protein
MKLLASILLFASATWFTSCKCSYKTYDCPAFNSAALSGWFPYGDITTLIFENGSGQRDSIYLKNTMTTEAHTITARSRSCYASKTFTSTENPTAGFKKLSIGLIRTEADNIMDEATVSVKADASFNFRGVTVNELGTANFKYSVPVSIQYLPSVSLSGKTFTNVAISYRDTTNSKLSGVYKLYIAKNTGLVAYEDFPSRTLWVLQ